MKKNYIIVGAIAVTIAIGWLLISRPWNKQQSSVEEQKQESQQAQQNQQEQEGNVWYGDLKKSNDISRGNLMLFVKDSDRVIYIHTSRDYAQLVDKPVKILYDGDLNKFTLIDILAE